MGQNSGVVREGDLVDVGTVGLDVATVVDKPGVMVNVVDAPEPVKCLVGPFGICCVVGIAGEAGADVEEASIGNGYEGVPC